MKELKNTINLVQITEIQYASITMLCFCERVRRGSAPSAVLSCQLVQNDGGGLGYVQAFNVVGRARDDDEVIAVFLDFV